MEIIRRGQGPNRSASRVSEKLARAGMPSARSNRRQKEALVRLHGFDFGSAGSGGRFVSAAGLEAQHLIPLLFHAPGVIAARVDIHVQQILTGGQTVLRGIVVEQSEFMTTRCHVACSAESQKTNAFPT